MSASHGSVIPRRDAASPVAPLTYAQERIWIVERLAGPGPVYNLPLLVRLRERTTAEDIDRAFAELVRRHEALRTVFTEIDGRVWQRILPPYDPELEFHDLRRLPRDRRPAAAVAAANAQWAEPFDVTRGPLVRMSAIALGDDDWIVAATFHHLVADGWSLAIVERELRALLDARRRHAAATLEPLDIQFADYAAWQRSPAQERLHERHREYWTRHLKDAPAGVALAPDRPAASVASTAGATESFTVPREVAKQLHALAPGAKVTPYMVLLAAFFAFLTRVSGQRDIRIVSPIADRRLSQTEPVVGLFLNLLTLRAAIDGEASFTACLANIRNTVLEAYEHQDYPVELLQTAAGAGEAAVPMRRVAFGLQTALPPQATPGSAADAAAPGAGTARFDLSVIVVETPDGYSGVWEYRTALFDAATVRGWIRQFNVLLRSIAGAPETPVGRLALLDAADRAHILRHAQGIAHTSEWRSLLSMVDAHAARSPDATAVDAGGRTLTYAELQRRARSLALQLRALGVGRDTRVAVHLNRTPEWVAVFLAVLQTGGVYLPLDPGYPAERLDFILNDAAAALLIVDRDTQRATEHVSIRTLLVAEDAPLDDAGAVTHDDPRPEHAAYQIYTSGSTGLPKGAVLTHGGLGRLADAQRAVLAPGPADRVAAISPIGFDASVFELAMALANGATLCLARGSVTGETLAEHLTNAGVTMLTVPPAILASLPTVPVPHLHTIVCAGERCPASLADRWAPGRRFFNAYGPTECTVWATVHRCAPGEGDPPIGRPIAGSSAYVVDEWGNLCPPGTAGELWIGGDKVGLGYWNRPDLTADRFVGDPHAAGSGRAYRTGDLVRARHDGTLEFLGRLDRQIKVRGCRIEPDEIEAALERLDEVSQAAVTVSDGETPHARLIAHVVLARPADEGQLRQALARTLPRFMVPARIVALDALPRTPHGKVDHAALSRASVERDASTDVWEAPKGHIEETLASIWQEVLGIPQVSALSGFLSLGGHSLLLGRLFVRIREAFGIEPSMKELFEASTLREMAAALARRSPSDEPRSRIRRMPRLAIARSDLRSAGAGRPDGSAAT